MPPPCLKEYLECLKSEKYIYWELQCAEKIFNCLNINGRKDRRLERNETLKTERD